MNESTNTDPRLLVNKIRTPDGTVLQSIHRHDYQEHKDKNGETYMVDGGLDYARRILGQVHPYEELSVYTDADHQTIRAEFCWGTRGKDGRSPLEFKPIENLSTEHILAILETQNQLRDYIRKVFEDELAYRETLDESVRKKYSETN